MSQEKAAFPGGLYEYVDTLKRLFGLLFFFFFIKSENEAVALADELKALAPGSGPGE